MNTWSGRHHNSQASSMTFFVRKDKTSNVRRAGVGSSSHRPWYSRNSSSSRSASAWRTPANWCADVVVVGAGIGDVVSRANLRKVGMERITVIELPSTLVSSLRRVRRSPAVVLLRGCLAPVEEMDRRQLRVEREEAGTRVSNAAVGCEEDTCYGVAFVWTSKSI
jgi:hypothetical protein